MCAIFGVSGYPGAAKLTSDGLQALQHRGQESAGICVSNGQELTCHKGMGWVSDVFASEAVFDNLIGQAGIGQTRYSTAGSCCFSDAQPLLVDTQRGTIAIVHNGNLTNANSLRQELESQGSVFQSKSDTEVILHLAARSRQKSLADAVVEALRQVEGAYSVLILTPDVLIAARDPRGFRPLMFGRLKDRAPGWVFASETCAFDLIGAHAEREIGPGELMVVREGVADSGHFDSAKPNGLCTFEHVYFSRPDSVVFGRPVQADREVLGRCLARECPAGADIVVPVPDSGVPAALGYANESGIPFKFGLIRSHYVGRTFIEPSQASRDSGVSLKLNPVRSVIEGQRVVLVDDSIIRGTTSRRIVRMVRQAGAREVHLRISCPPTVSPCYYGIDTPTREELIASSHSVEEIRQFVGADSLGYLSLEGLRRAVDDQGGLSCYSCWTGSYPTEVPLVQITS